MRPLAPVTSAIGGLLVAHEAPQRRDVRPCRVRDHLLDHGHFDRPAGREYMRDVGRGRARHDGDPAIAQRHDALVRKPPERLSHDGARYAEKFAKRDLLQLGARRQAPFEDRCANRIADAALGSRLFTRRVLGRGHGSRIGPRSRGGQWFRHTWSGNSCIQDSDTPS